MNIDKNSNVLQPQLIATHQLTQTLTVVISGFALGGAEKIVLDWITRINKSWHVHLVLLRNQECEWPLPKDIIVSRFNGIHVLQKLKVLGESLAASNNKTCLTHLLTHKEQQALREGGAFVKQVFHNARNGWRESASDLDKTLPIIAVSHACKQDLLDDGWEGDISVIHHIPRARTYSSTVRLTFREQWNISESAYVIGMIGAVKPQKDYLHALRILKELHVKGVKAYLVILGGPIGKDGKKEWRKVVNAVHELGLRKFVAMPGFVQDAMRCLPAFDMILNTSHYEGLSIATLETLSTGISVVASDVGGQGEVAHNGLMLVSKQAPHLEWVKVILEAKERTPTMPVWKSFPSYRMWTLHHLVYPYEPSNKVLFVTANLNSGGAQRSLVNLTTHMQNNDDFAVAVTGNSTVDHFFKSLFEAGVETFRTSAENDVFEDAEALITYCNQEHVGTMCFWNTDPKLKLLLSSVTGTLPVRLIDVSPGGHAFEELSEAEQFAQRVCVTEEQYYESVDAIVHKFEGEAPDMYRGNQLVIRNGIPEPKVCKHLYQINDTPSVAVCGRIAESKFLHEIVKAVSAVNTSSHPGVMLHVYGAAEPRAAEYAESMNQLVRELLPNQVVFHGLTFDAREKFSQHDVFVVLGKHQGCPNALLEALSVGMPVVANDDGGTREQVIDGKTGILIDSTSPQELASSLSLLLSDRSFAEHVGVQGRTHVMRQFSMQEMVARYSSLFWNEIPENEGVNVHIA